MFTEYELFDYVDQLLTVMAHLTPVFQMHILLEAILRIQHNAIISALEMEG